MNAKLKANAKPKARAKKQLTPKQVRVINTYTDPDSPGFSNKTHTGKIALNIEDPNYAHVAATRVLQNDTVQNEIERIYRRIGKGKEVRQHLRADLLDHELVGKTITRTEDGKTVIG